MSRHAIGIVLVVSCTAFPGCAGIAVRRADGPRLLDAWKASLVQADGLSPRSRQTLRRWDLETVYGQNPLAAQAHLHNYAVLDPQPDVLFALAEISYQLGQIHEKKGACGEAAAFYFLCAGYAYHYLFPCGTGPAGPTVHQALKPVTPVVCLLDAAAGTQPSPFDPRFRLACDLYNEGLSKCIRHAQKAGRLDPRQELRLPTFDGQGFALTIAHHGFLWRPEEFGPLLLASDFEVFGLANQYRNYGLGVPLIGTRDPAAPAPAYASYPRAVSFPVTAFFRFEGGLADLRSRRAGRLELYNPLAIHTVAVNGKPIPLQADLTTPLAYFLDHTDLNTSYLGFLQVERVQRRAGIYMFEPYQPGKIPVLMVHGLLSSPLTWAPLFNDLRADPQLRDRYQFWFYLYPTGNPYLLTAADLRDALHQLRADVDPSRSDPALDNLVLVGHSMGGLISKLLTVDSNDDFWRLVSKESFERIKARPESRKALQRVFFFTHMPEVRRVIFLGTPHRGSKLSPSWPGRLAVRLVRLPQPLMQVAEDIVKENPSGILPALHTDRLPTSIDLLAPESPALQLLAARRPACTVAYHSIIGVVPSQDYLTRLVLGSDDPKGTDGVVPYSSAHLDDAVSEVVVPADHMTVHHHPLAVLEVRRILLEHLENLTR